MITYINSASGVVDTPDADYTGADILIALDACFETLSAGQVSDTENGLAYSTRSFYAITGDPAIQMRYVASPIVSASMHAHTNDGFPALMLAGFAGLDPVTPYTGVTDGNTNASATSINAGGTGVTPPFPDCLIVSGAALSTGFAGSVSIDSGFTHVAADDLAFASGTNYGFSWAYLIQSGGPSGVNPNWAWSGACPVATGLWVFAMPQGVAAATRRSRAYFF